MFNRLIYPTEKSNCVIKNNHFAQVIMQSLALKKIRIKRKQQLVANDSFTVKLKTQKTTSNFLLKKPNEQANYKFEQKKTNCMPVWKELNPQLHHFHISKQKFKVKILYESINLIENSPMVIEKMTPGPCRNIHHVNPQTISITLPVKKFK